MPFPSIRFAVDFPSSFLKVNSSKLRYVTQVVLSMLYLVLRNEFAILNCLVSAAQGINGRRGPFMALS